MASKVQGAKNRRVAAIQQTEVVNAVKGLSIDSVSRSITETQVEVQRVLADLSGRVMERLQELENLEETIRVRTDDLKKLHEIEVKATTLDEMEEQIKEQRRAWEEEQLLKKRDFAEHLARQLEASVESYARLILVAPPGFLGDLRAALGDAARRKLTGTLDKDLVRARLAEVVAHLDAMPRD